MPRLTAGANRRKQEPGEHSMTEPTNDNPQLSLGAIIASLPAVKVAKKDDGKDSCQILTQACDLDDKPGSDETPARSRFVAVH
jgi:hypothetical protein